MHLQYGFDFHKIKKTLLKLEHLISLYINVGSYDLFFAPQNETPNLCDLILKRPLLPQSRTYAMWEIYQKLRRHVHTVTESKYSFSEVSSTCIYCFGSFALLHIIIIT
jgi:hypothetical protein